MTLNVSEIVGLMTLNSTCSFRDRNNDAKKKKNPEFAKHGEVGC